MWFSIFEKSCCFFVLTLHRPANVDEEGKLKKVIDGKRDDNKGIGQGLSSLGDLQNLMNQEEDDDNDIDDSMSSSAMDDGLSSMYKSKMHSEFRGNQGDESAYLDSASVSNFRQD